MRTLVSAFFAVALALCVGKLHAGTLTYYAVDFEDGTLGGGTKFPHPSMGEASNIASNNLMGRSLLFELEDQLVWSRNNANGQSHFVSFDYHSERGADVTFFLDAPWIARFDFRLIGTHHVDLSFDLTTGIAVSMVDGAVDTGSGRTYWHSNPVPDTMRIGNQRTAPGNSTGSFEIDNLKWTANTIAEPSTYLLIAAGVIPFLASRRRRVTHSLKVASSAHRRCARRACREQASPLPRL